MKKSIRLVLALAVLYAILSNWTELASKAASVKHRLYSAAWPADGPASPVVQGEAFYLIDEKSGKMLLGKNIHERLYPASTTKILTALIAIEKGNPDDVVTVGDEVNLRQPDESSAGLVQG